MPQSPMSSVAETSPAATMPAGAELHAALAAELAARQRLERRLQDLERQVADVEAAASLGIWEWDTVSDAIHWSDGQLRLHGIDQSRHPYTFQAFLDLVHPDDRAMVIRECDELRRTSRPFSFPYRVVRPDGIVRWQQAHGQMVSNPESG